jgi:hypothetical protein
VGVSQGCHCTAGEEQRAAVSLPSTHPPLSSRGGHVSVWAFTSELHRCTPPAIGQG